MLRLANLGAIKGFLTESRATRRLVRRYVAGEHLQDGLEAVRRLNAAGTRASLNFLGEDVLDEPAAERACRAYLDQLDLIAPERLDANVSVKLTQLGLAFDPTVAGRKLERIVEQAAECGNFIRVDMESSAYTQATLDIVHAIFDRLPNVGVVIQAYLYRSPGDLEQLLRRGVRVRLCKGAYREPPSLAYPRKADVDRSYARLAERLLDGGSFPALATHDTRLIHHARRYAAGRGITSDRFEFQLLYGVRRDVQAQIIEHGYGLRVYVPYGADWYPYLTRRLAERPANLAFVLGSLARERGGSPGRTPP